MSDITATQAASAMYNKAKNIATGKTDLEVSYATVGGILFLGFFYMVISSIGMSVYSKCDAMKGQKVQESKWNGECDRESRSQVLIEILLDFLTLHGVTLGIDAHTN